MSYKQDVFIDTCVMRLVQLAGILRQQQALQDRLEGVEEDYYNYRRQEFDECEEF